MTLKMLPLVLLMLMSLMTTSRAGVGWKELSPMDLRIWMLERDLSWPGAVLDLLGKADEVKGGSVADGAKIAWLYQLEDGHQLEMTFGEGVEPRSQVMYEYRVWKVAASGERTQVWKSAIGKLRLEFDKERAAKGKGKSPKYFEGDLPEHRYEMKGEGAVG